MAGVEVFGQRVDVAFRVRETEDIRRRALGVGALDSHDVIRALMTLPEGIPLAGVGLEVDARLVLEDLVRLGAVDEVEGLVVRRAVPPVQLLGLVKVTSTWSEVQAITLLRTHAPRLVVVPPRLGCRVLREIDPEVGVVVTAGDGSTVCRRAPGRAAVRPTWRRWVTAETAYAAWLSATCGGLMGGRS